jgi:nucleoside-diphosphate-sugar epimerase
MTNENQQKFLENVAVIGCGYVGKAVASYWYKQGYFVTGTTTREEKLSELESCTHQRFIMTGNNLAELEKVIENQNTILVSIAPISDRQVDPETYAETYINTTTNLVKILKNNSTVKQVIYLSSGSVYGDKKGKLVDENSPLDTENDYSKVLVKAEQIMLGIDKPELKVCILRLGGIYGPKRELNKRLARFAGETIPGDGKNYAGWIHLDDIVSAIEFVHQKGCQGIYNLVNDVKLTSKELFDLICDRQNLERVSWDESKPYFSSLNAIVDNTKIKQEGYKFIYSNTLI